uniref:AAA+ ATPase domain-containing protein n=3 Tax=Ditylum brightwellii TaxID=49249 RepID=A0A7S4R359_9STRA
MPLPPPPADLFAELKARKKKAESTTDETNNEDKGLRNSLLTSLQNLSQSRLSNNPPPTPPLSTKELKLADTHYPKHTNTKTLIEESRSKIPPGKLFHYDVISQTFCFSFEEKEPKLVHTLENEEKETYISIPLTPCVYRMTDYTFAKKENISLHRCILKLNVLRCLQRECQNLNSLLWHRLNPDSKTKVGGKMEEEELGKTRFMELISNVGIYNQVSELILQRCAEVTDLVGVSNRKTVKVVNCEGVKNPYQIPKVVIPGLEEFLQEIEKYFPSLHTARKEIETSQSVSFYPGLGELFTPGSKLLCYPDGMEGSPLGCSTVQSWYAEEVNKATNTIKRRFVLVVEFIVSVGDQLVFVAASDVYPEFHDASRNVPLKDLTHRVLNKDCEEDALLLDRLQERGEFYASVSTHNHYLEYYSDSFFPIMTGASGWSNNAVRPLSKGGRVMVDVKRGILEGHLPVRGAADGMSDTVKEAIKLFEQSKRTGVAVPFRTCILPGFEEHPKNRMKVLQEGRHHRGDSDRSSLWQSWPMLTGFSFTARVWGKLLLGMPKLKSSSPPKRGLLSAPPSPGGTLMRRSSVRKMGVEIGALGGEGSCGNCGYIQFQEQAFEQLVLDEDKKELIRAVARNAGGGVSTAWDDEGSYTDDSDDEEDVGLDVVANKGGASIFLLHGPPGCGKTLTAEAIAELLRKPLYIVTAGDLGITASEVEKTLGSVLELCQTWDALVLIDEADVFLEARSSTEIQRNALVCVMLRLLEYYSGCLFLSSNRAGKSIDAAIASRITVMLGYPSLNVDGRGKVWKNLIELVPAQPLDPTTKEVPARIANNPRKASKYRVNFTTEDYQSLAEAYQLNGRQIKNSIVLARALARERGSPLSMSILQRAVTAVAGEDVEVPSN